MFESTVAARPERRAAREYTMPIDEPIALDRWRPDR
jgi:hypothetical protein